jgi:hypothetical protein
MRQTMILTGEINLKTVTDPTVPFRRVNKELGEADLVFANLECLFAEALWYSPECKIVVLSNTYLNISTFQHPEKRVQRCARPLRFHSTSPM